MVFDIVTFGSAVIDVFIDSSQYDKKQKSFVFKSGEKILVNDMRDDIGGGAINSSVGFSRMGYKTGCICKIGRGTDGESIRKLLREEKVSFLGSYTDDGKSGHSIILDYPGMDRTILKYNGYCEDMRVGEIKPFRSKWLYYSSLSGNGSGAQEDLAARMKKKGVRLAFNPSAYLARKFDIRPVLLMTDVLILNKEEARVICDKFGKKKKALKFKVNDPEGLLERLMEFGPKLVVITDGPRTVYASDGLKTYTVEPKKNVKIVERTGAGDAFAVGFISGIMAEKSIKDSLKIGIKLSSSVLGSFGARNKIPRLDLKNVAKEK